jgi:3-dehydroquinate synthase
VLLQIYSFLCQNDITRADCLIALGGGVIGDLTGFAAATYLRGLPYVQIPTSLLAQVDSSVGGKVAVNHALGKNLIGAFYQPKAVFMDLEMMETLPPREISTGLGEVVKYGLIYDADFFSYLESQVGAILALEHGSLSHLIARCCEIKAAVVSEDEKEAGLRRILNFGHTIGHAIEKETGYARYNHGEAVAIGMVGAVRLSISLGLLSADVLSRTEKLLQALNLPIRAEGCTVDKMYEDIFHDKKTVGGKVTWVLLAAVGKTVCKSDVSEKDVREAMAYCLI